MQFCLVFHLKTLVGEYRKITSPLSKDFWKEKGTLTSHYMRVWLESVSLFKSLCSLKSELKDEYWIWKANSNLKYLHLNVSNIHLIIRNWCRPRTPQSFAFLNSRKYVKHCSKEKRIFLNGIRTNIYSVSFSLEERNKLELIPAFGCI